MNHDESNVIDGHFCVDDVVYRCGDIAEIDEVEVPLRE